MQPKANLKEEEIRQWSREIIKEIKSDFRMIPLNSLKSSKYSLKKPLIILQEKDDSHYIASLDDIEAFSVADTEYEAIDGLREEIVQVYEDLLTSPRNLGPLPQKWFHFLNDYIEKR